ncbi:MAG: hypothetical protein N3B21_13485 [Clostridia bacterium]|nr:hypothetical protein [Clostridia bacterium]
MSGKILSNITIKGESRSYINCLYALLTAAGMFSMPKYMLSGMTGMAFKFTIHNKLLPSSVDMYNPWENWRAVDTLGIYSEVFSGSIHNPTFPLYKKEALRKIKQTIDDGKAVIAWGLNQPLYYLICGYDDVDRVFFFKYIHDDENDVMLYDNFGFVNQGDWSYQLVGDSIHKDIRDIYRASFQIAIDEWEAEYKVNPEYASGRSAYRNLINALKTGDVHDFGPYHIMETYIKSKHEIHMYMQEVIKELPQLKQAAELYRHVAGIYQNISSLSVAKSFIEDRKFVPTLVELFEIALKKEEAAVRELKIYINEIMGNSAINPTRLKDI